ncbi:acetoin utilization protein AcuC [Rudaeicoccus suwonensis]|uniref:Acetoin utilization protein AcuC n=1 Tax=Rudaeicoccus suwonensis TaxID=657409 RepID=A0A561DUB2_9MICO|nr:acetoin utilization protein AcuC [Rudaeicoccus suwonensis]TWE06910.1 acetoin utilization protein AcuC [Rudaeicoccus suwonensis]
MSSAAPRVQVVWDDSLTGYDFGPDHPMNPVRLELTARLSQQLGVFDAPGVAVVKPSRPGESDEFLRRVHTADYIDAVRAASADPAGADPAYGLGTEDDPAFRGMHEASALIAGSSVALAEALHRGEIDHGVNFCGGLHHAMPGSASGFCIYNDPALAISWLLDHGVERVAYVDLDVHHGDGVERVFWNDPRVLTASIHETGRVLFPGTGFPGDVGGPQAEGTAVNIALPPGTRDAAWLRALHAVVPPVLRAFQPQFIVTQQGCDSHYSDPLAHMALSIDAQRTAYELLHDLTHEITDGRWLALGGGGYEVIDVVPRAWTHLAAIAAHRPIPLDTPLPQQWRDEVQSRFGRPGPARMGDGQADEGRVWWRSWESGADPEDPTDRAILATREAIFPHHGLDVWFD